MKNKIYLIIAVLSICIIANNIYSQTKYLPKTYINNATNYAVSNFASNATMFGITSALGVDTTGKSALWVYWFYKPGVNDTGYAVTIIVIAGFPIPTGIRTTSLPGSLLRPLGNAFCESNIAITAAENAGGRNFRLTYPNTTITGNIYKIPGMPDTSKPYWSFIYRDSLANQFRVYNIDGITCTLVVLGISQTSNEIPGIFKLEQNYPNPFNPHTIINFALSQRSDISLIVYNSLGVEVAELYKGNLQAGVYSADFDASILPSGIYFYKLAANDFSETKKMVLIK